MKITAIATFPRIKDGIPRAAEELLKELGKNNQVDSIWVIAWPDSSSVSPSLLANTKMHFFAPGRYPNPWALKKMITLYKEADLLLFLPPPWRVFDPSKGLWFFLLIKYGFLSGSKWVQVLYDFIPYICPDDEGGQKRAKRLFDAFKKYGFLAKSVY